MRLLGCSSILLLVLLENWSHAFQPPTAPTQHLTVGSSCTTKNNGKLPQFYSKSSTRLKMASPELPDALASEGDWTAYLDEESTGLIYYFNGKTGESRWEPPTSTFPEVYLKPQKRRIARLKREEYQKAVKLVDEETEEQVKKGGIFGFLGGKEKEQPAVAEQTIVEEDNAQQEVEQSNWFQSVLTSRKEAEVPVAAGAIEGSGEEPPASDDSERRQKPGFFETMFAEEREREEQAKAAATNGESLVNGNVAKTSSINGGATTDEKVNGGKKSGSWLGKLFDGGGKTSSSPSVNGANGDSSQSTFDDDAIMQKAAEMVERDISRKVEEARRLAAAKKAEADSKVAAAEKAEAARAAAAERAEAAKQTAAAKKAEMEQQSKLIGASVRSDDDTAAQIKAQAQKEQEIVEKKIEEARLAQIEAKKAEEARLLEENRLLEEAAEQVRLEKEAARREEEARIAEERRVAEEAQEAARLQEESRLAEEARIQEQMRRDEEERIAAEEAARVAEEEEMREAVRRAEEEQRIETARIEAEIRRAEEEERRETARIEAEVRRAEAAEKARAVAEARKEEAARLREEASRFASDLASKASGIFSVSRKGAADATVDFDETPEVAPLPEEIEVYEEAPVKVEMGSFVLPHPAKILWGGEDAVFTQGRTFGVFDGVSGAVKRDGAPLYSKTLAQEFRRSSGSEGLNTEELTGQLAVAADKANRVATGASTACVASISDNGFLRAINLGDCCCYLIRNGKVAKRTGKRSHYFDCPYQLSEDSPDRPTDSTKLNVELVRGDIIMMASDGIYDNLFDKEILQIIDEANEAGVKSPRAIAKKISDASRKVSLSNTAETPYAKEAKKKRDPDYLNGVGGKVDDISCVIVRYS